MSSFPLTFEYSFGEEEETTPVTVTTTTAPETALPIGRDLELDPVTHDLVLEGGDLQLVNDLDAIRQEADIRLKFFLGEWFLDTTVGIPYFQSVLVKAPNLGGIKTVFNDELLLSAGIVSVKKLDLVFSRSTRKLTIDWAAECNTGELVSSNVLFEA